MGLSGEANVVGVKVVFILKKTNQEIGESIMAVVPSAGDVVKLIISVKDRKVLSKQYKVVGDKEWDILPALFADTIGKSVVRVYVEEITGD